VKAKLSSSLQGSVTMAESTADPNTLGLPPVEAVDQLPPEALSGFAMHLAALQARVAVRIASATQGENCRRPAQDTEDSQLLTVAQVADVFAVPVGCVRDLLRRGALPTVRVGRKYVRVHRADIQDYIAAQKNSGVDMPLFHRYKSPHDRKAAPGGSQAARTYPTRIGQATRPRGKFTRPPGARRAKDLQDTGDPGPAHRQTASPTRKEVI